MAGPEQKTVRLQSGDLVCFSVQPDASKLPEDWRGESIVMEVVGFHREPPHLALAQCICKYCGQDVKQWFDPATELLFLQRATHH